MTSIQRPLTRRSFIGATGATTIAFGVPTLLHAQARPVKVGLIHPFTGGGANWGGLAFDAGRQIAYINTSSAMHMVTLIPADRVKAARAAEPGEEISPQTGAPYGMRRVLLEQHDDLARAFRAQRAR